MPEGPTFIAAVVASAPAANKAHLVVHNAHATSKVRIHRVLAAPDLAIAVTGLVISLRVSRFIAAAPTGGTAVTPIAAVTADALPAGITARAGATSAITEQLPFGTGAIQGEETASYGQALLHQHLISGVKPFELVNGEGIVVRQSALASAGPIDVVVWFTVIP